MILILTARIIYLDGGEDMRSKPVYYMSIMCRIPSWCYYHHGMSSYMWVEFLPPKCLLDASCFVVVCKGCIVKYLQSNAQCPICGTVVNETHPLTSLRADRTMQDIVYKMVPELEISKQLHHTPTTASTQFNYTIPDLTTHWLTNSI